MLHATALWLPALVATFAVFVASAMVWMAMPHHKKDFAEAKDEDGFMDAVRSAITDAVFGWFRP